MTKWYEIKLPSNIVARPNDGVNYSATGLKQKNKIDYQAAACFHAHMAQLPKYEYECRPQNGSKKSLLPKEEYLQWMHYCVSYGLVPLDSEAWSKKDMNYARISGRYETKHRIYAGLCCYRWADSLAPLCYTVVKLLEAKPEINFYQALHYGMAKFVTLVGHSFTSVSAANMSLYGNGYQKTARLDLGYGLATKFFFQRDADGKCPADEANQAGWTYDAINAYAGKLGLVCPVKNVNEILDEKWIEFYSSLTFNKKLLKSYYDDNVKKK